MTAATAVVLLFLFLPSTWAATPPLLSLRAPYGGSFVVHTGSGAGRSGCANGSGAAPVRFNLTTRIAKGAISLNQTACGTGFGNLSFGEQIVGLVTTPVTVATNGTYTLRETWRATYSVAIVVTHSNSSTGPYAWGDAVLEAFGGVRDLTAKHPMSGNTTVLAQYFAGYSNASLRIHTSTRAVASVTMALVAGHSYEFVAYFVVLVDTFASGGSAAHIRSLVDWNSGSNGATLVSFTVS